jgi:hypothetical protein
VPISCFLFDAPFSLRRRAKPFLLFLLLILPLSLSATPAQAQEGASSVPACILNKGIYTCEGVTFQKDLANAKTVSLETNTIDKVAQSQLRDFITKKLGKTIVSEGSPTELIFLMYPIEGEGMTFSPGETDRGTLRVYLPGPDNKRGALIWAEVLSSREDMPWPAVVHGLIAQFQSHFHIK